MNGHASDRTISESGFTNYSIGIADRNHEAEAPLLQIAVMMLGESAMSRTMQQRSAAPYRVSGDLEVEDNA